MVGKHPKRPGKQLFIRNQSGKFWLGWDFNDGPDALTPEELFGMAQSIQDDLVMAYPKKFNAHTNAPGLLENLLVLAEQVVDWAESPVTERRGQYAHLMNDIVPELKLALAAADGGEHEVSQS